MSSTRTSFWPLQLVVLLPSLLGGYTSLTLVAMVEPKVNGLRALTTRPKDAGSSFYNCVELPHVLFFPEGICFGVILREATRKHILWGLPCLDTNPN